MGAPAQPLDPEEFDEATSGLRPAREAQHHPDSAETLARGAKLLQLRVARLTYAQIAEQMGYSNASNARQALIKALERHEAEDAHELRQVENLALDADERQLRAIITAADTSASTKIKAIDSRLRLSARRSRLNGLDAPVQVAIDVGVKAELEDALASLGDLVLGEVLDVTEEPYELGEGEGPPDEGGVSAIVQVP